MVEQLEVSQLLANEFEPKREFEWILDIEGVDAFVVKTFARPQKTQEDITIDYINQKRFLAGKGAWEPLEMTLYDPIAPSAVQKVMDWLRLVHDDTVGRMGYAVMYKRNFSLKMLDPQGAVVEKWNIVGAWPRNIDFGKLDYASSEAVMITMTIRMDRAENEF